MVGNIEFHKHNFKFYSLKWFITQQTMCNPKLLCLPPIANTFRDLDIRFTWVIKGISQFCCVCYGFKTRRFISRLTVKYYCFFVRCVCIKNIDPAVSWSFCKHTTLRATYGPSSGMSKRDELVSFSLIVICSRKSQQKKVIRHDY